MNTLRVILSAEGFNALPASNGFDAIRLTREQRPIVALIDLDRSGRDALALVRSLRRASPNQSLRVIGVTVEPRDIDLHTLGIDTVLAKPLDVDTLVSALIVQVEQSLAGTRVAAGELACVTG